MKEESNSGKLAKGGKKQIAAPKVDPNVAQSAQATIDPISAVDELRGQVLTKVGGRTDSLAQADAQFLANQPAHYLDRLTQHMGAAEVVPVDGFLAYLDDVCSSSVDVHRSTEVAIGAK